jgi:hypothetical protein
VRRWLSLLKRPRATARRESCRGAVPIVRDVRYGGRAFMNLVERAFRDFNAREL